MHSQQPPGVVQNWSTLQCSKHDTEQCGYDHAPVTRGRMRTQFPLPHGPVYGKCGDLCASGVTSGLVVGATPPPLVHFGSFALVLTERRVFIFISHHSVDYCCASLCRGTGTGQLDSASNDMLCKT